MKQLSEQYLSYISSDDWKVKRGKAIAHYGSKCHYCGRSKKLQVHHRSYKRLGNEPLSDLMVVCEVCHEEIHRRKEKGLKPLRRRKNLRKKSKTKQWESARISLAVRKAEEFERRRYAIVHADD